MVRQDVWLCVAVVALAAMYLWRQTDVRESYEPFRREHNYDANFNVRVNRPCEPGEIDEGDVCVSMGCPQGFERGAAGGEQMCYPKCVDGYESNGMSRCYRICPPEYTTDGTQCVRPAHAFEKDRVPVVHHSIESPLLEPRSEYGMAMRTKLAREAGMQAGSGASAVGNGGPGGMGEYRVTPGFLDPADHLTRNKSAAAPTDAQAQLEREFVDTITKYAAQSCKACDTAYNASKPACMACQGDFEALEGQRIPIIESNNSILKEGFDGTTKNPVVPSTMPTTEEQASGSMGTNINTPVVTRRERRFFHADYACPFGYSRSGDMCYENCPPGYYQDGDRCHRDSTVVDRESYDRGAGVPFRRVRPKYSHLGTV